MASRVWPQWAGALRIGYVASLATKLSDTFASEIGKVKPSGWCKQTGLNDVKRPSPPPSLPPSLPPPPPLRHKHQHSFSSKRRYPPLLSYCLLPQAYGKRTFLITTLKPVPPGTEGAVSLEGTLAGVVGSIIIAGFAGGSGVVTKQVL